MQSFHYNWAYGIRRIMISLKLSVFRQYHSVILHNTFFLNWCNECGEPKLLSDRRVNYFCRSILINLQCCLVMIIFQRVSTFNISSTEAQMQNEQCQSTSLFNILNDLKFKSVFLRAFKYNFFFSRLAQSFFFFTQNGVSDWVETLVIWVSLNLVVLAREEELLCLLFFGCAWKQWGSNDFTSVRNSLLTAQYIRGSAAEFVNVDIATIEIRILWKLT